MILEFNISLVTLFCLFVGAIFIIYITLNKFYELGYENGWKRAVTKAFPRLKQTIINEYKNTKENQNG